MVMVVMVVVGDWGPGGVMNEKRGSAVGPSVYLDFLFPTHSFCTKSWCC